MDSVLGEAKSIERDNKFTLAIEFINKALEKFPKLICLIVEKMKLELAAQSWDRCFELSSRAIEIDNKCLEAFRYQILETLCRYGRYDEVIIFN